MKSGAPLLFAGAALLLLSSSKKKNGNAAQGPAQKPKGASGQENEQHSQGEPSDPEEPGSGGSNKGPMPGPSSCVAKKYSREPLELSLGARAGFANEDALNQALSSKYNLIPSAQIELIERLRSFYQSMFEKNGPNTVRSVALREQLEELTGCNWHIPIDEMDPAEYLMWESANQLAGAIEREVGIAMPTEPKGEYPFVIARERVGKPQIYFDPSIDQRVEFIATDESMQHAEHVFGKVVDVTADSALVEVVGVFADDDVSPDFGHKHGFTVGTQKQFPKKTPSGIYRMYPKGLV